jgi:hypothetical protein
VKRRNWHGVVNGLLAGVTTSAVTGFRITARRVGLGGAGVSGEGGHQADASQETGNNSGAHLE